MLCEEVRATRRSASMVGIVFMIKYYMLRKVVLIEPTEA